MEQVEARNAIRHPSMPRIAPHNNNYPLSISIMVRLRELAVHNGETPEVSEQGSDKIMLVLIPSQT